MGMLTVLRIMGMFIFTGLVVGVFGGVAVLAMFGRLAGFFVSMIAAVLPLWKQRFGGFARAKENRSHNQRNHHRFSQQSGN
jgi:cell division protein FtsX